MPDVNQPKPEMSWKIERIAPASLPETGGPPPARRRGAQPGNHNAFKHGFYSRSFTPLEITDLEEIKTDGLDDEIVLIRVITRRVAQLMRGVKYLDDAIAGLNALGMANIRLASLLRTKRELSGDFGSTFVSMLSTALSEVRQELKL